MANWGAILAGLGAGASTLGTSIDQKALLKQQRQRQLAEDAFKRFVDMNQMGASNATPENVQSAFIGQNRAIGEAGTPSELLALGPATDPEITELPGLQGGVDRIVVNPDKSAQSLAAQRAMKQITATKGMDFQRESALEQMREAARQRQTQATQQFDLGKLDRTEKFTGQQNDLTRKNRMDAARVALSGIAGTFAQPGEDGAPQTIGYTRSGQTIPFGGAKPFAGAGGVGGKPVVGAQAPLNDMIARYRELEQHGKDIGAGTFQFGAPNSTREALKFGTAYNQSEGKPALGTTVGGDVMDFLGMTDPKVQNRYDMMATANRAMGDDAAKVFKGRQGFQNIGFEVAQQKFDKSDIGQPEKVAQKLDRMKHIIQLAATVAPEQASQVDPKILAEFGINLPSAPKGKTMTQAEYNALSPMARSAAKREGYKVVP